MNDSINCITKSIAIILQFIGKLLACHQYSTSLDVVRLGAQRITVLKIIKHVRVSECLLFFGLFLFCFVAVETLPSGKRRQSKDNQFSSFCKTTTTVT